MLGHELQHAVEIAEAVDVIDAASMATLYRRIGEPTRSVVAAQCYDTAAARDVGTVVLTELRARTRKVFTFEPTIVSGN